MFFGNRGNINSISIDISKLDENEIEHYRKVIACCKSHGVEPLVTLLHFTCPVWLIQKGGWEAETTIEYFRRYAAYVTEKLGSELSGTRNSATTCPTSRTTISRSGATSTGA